MLSCQGNENSLEKVSLGGPALHVFLARSYTEYLKTFFEEMFLCSQKLLSSEEIYEKVLDRMSQLLPSSEGNGRIVEDLLWVKKITLLNLALTQTTKRRPAISVPTYIGVHRRVG
ncbi:uncharacterized protein LOC141623600 [Silene latifolia]|uniref:uncharacterized protein LOC141623600 n=1 Tax=Silene latifolia TaxID=37657 RepID=UPI003D76FC39